GDTRGVRVTLDDQGWSTVKDVMDGKFRLVARGVAQTAYPGWSDSWPWTCMGPGHGCWRTALARTATRGWLLIMGQRGSYYGLTTPDWARVLQRLGAVDAMGFDSNSAAELYRAGGAGIANPDGGRVIPATTALRYS
ncbi:MAG: phosphodiester glycosidase family protein, partial [Gaiellales bacterium]